MAVEAKRGCGYRKVGGLYLVGGPGGLACDRLPIELDICPCCGAGIKQSLGWTWVNIPTLVGGEHWERVEVPVEGSETIKANVAAHCTCPPECPLCWNVKSMGKGGLLWVGAQFYPTISAFEHEARTLGVSKRIGALPRGFELGKTWVLLAHPKGIVKPTGDNLTAKWAPAIFRVWKPQRLERIYKESDRGGEAALADEKRGITPVYVPDNDPDHQGSAYDKEKKASPNDSTPPLFS